LDVEIKVKQPSKKRKSTSGKKKIPFLNECTIQGKSVFSSTYKSQAFSVKRVTNRLAYRLQKSRPIGTKKHKKYKMP